MPASCAVVLRILVYGYHAAGISDGWPVELANLLTVIARCLALQKWTKGVAFKLVDLVRAAVGHLVRPDLEANFVPVVWWIL